MKLASCGAILFALAASLHVEMYSPPPNIAALQQQIAAKVTSPRWPAS